MEENKEENWYTSLTPYRIPIAIGVLGIIFIIFSFMFTLARQAPKEISFIEKSSTLSAKNYIKADVEGSVMNPGVYELTMGSRIEDLLIAAGGLSFSADRVWIAKNLNKAAKLTDGGKLYIPAVDENITNSRNVIGSESTTESGVKVNINIATITELDNLPGIGLTIANKIISGRPYQNIEELKARKIVGNAVFEQIKDLISAF